VVRHRRDDHVPPPRDGTLAHLLATQGPEERTGSSTARSGPVALAPVEWQNARRSPQSRPMGTSLRAGTQLAYLARRATLAKVPEVDPREND
jgi:hypothetical protein